MGDELVDRAGDANPLKEAGKRAGHLVIAELVAAEPTWSPSLIVFAAVMSSIQPRPERIARQTLPPASE